LKFVSPDVEPFDYHLTPGSSALGKATAQTFQAGQKDEDFDGEERPTDQRDLGADEIK